MARFTDRELMAEEAQSNNDYAGGGPMLNVGYHYDASGDEVTIERQVFRRFMERPHAHQNGYQ